MRVTTLMASYLLDWIMGDPEFLPHPVRLIGSALARLEKRLNLRLTSRRIACAYHRVRRFGE